MIAGQRMGRLIDGLLELSRLTRAEIRYETVDLSGLVEAIAEERKQSDPERQVEFVIEKGLVAEGDRQLLRVALENLLSNAWKFTEKRARTELGVAKHEGAPAYFVRDNGVGFDMAYAEKLVGVFQRLHGPDEFEGTGIGLAMAARIVQRHGGRMWAEGEVGRGATDAYRKAVRLLHTAYDASGMAKELSGRADALALLASVLHRSLDEPTEALETYEAAAGGYRELGDAHRLRKVLLGLAGLRWRARNSEGAAGGYEEALELAREHGEAAHEVVALMSLSVVYRDLGRLRESVRCGRATLELLRGLEDPWAEAYVLSSLAESHRKLGHHPSALSCLKRSLRLRKKLGDEEGMIGVLQDLSRVYESLGESERARACAREVKERVPEGVLGSERRG